MNRKWIVLLGMILLVLVAIFLFFALKEEQDVTLKEEKNQSKHLQPKKTVQEKADTPPEPEAPVEGIPEGMTKISGCVLSFEGEPVTDGTVVVVSGNEEKGMAPDEQGNYSVFVQNDVTVLLTTDFEKRTSLPAEVWLSPDELKKTPDLNIDFRMEACATVFGYVRDKQGVSVANATVSFSRRQGELLLKDAVAGSVNTWPHIAPQVTTNEKGLFVSNKVPLDIPFRVVASGDGLKTAVSEEHILAGFQKYQVDLETSAAAVLFGKIYFPDGAIADNRFFRTFLWHHEDRIVEEALVTNSKGEYYIPNLPIDGQQCWLEGFLMEPRKHVSLSVFGPWHEGENYKDIVLTEREASTQNKRVGGYVKPEGKDAQKFFQLLKNDLECSYWEAREHPLSVVQRQVTHKHRNVFMIFFEETKKYDVVVTLKGKVVKKWRNVSSESLPLWFEFKELLSGRILGTITDGNSLGIETVGVSLYAEQTWLSDSPDVHETQTDENGRFVFNSVPYGSYILCVQGSRKPLKISLSDSELTVDSIVLMPSGSVEGEIVGGTGFNEYSRVRLLSKSYPKVKYEAKVEKDNRFVFEKVESGEYWISFIDLKFHKEAMNKQLNQDTYETCIARSQLKVVSDERTHCRLICKKETVYPLILAPAHSMWKPMTSRISGTVTEVPHGITQRVGVYQNVGIYSLLPRGIYELEIDNRVGLYFYRQFDQIRTTRTYKFPGNESYKIRVTIPGDHKILVGE